MMNKKLKIAVALVLILQLLASFSLLIYNNAVMKTTLEKGTELKFRLINIYEHTMYTDEKLSVNFYIDGFVYNNKNVKISSDSEGFARFYTEGGENDWINRDFVYKAQKLTADEISIVEPFTKEDFKVYLRRHDYSKDILDHFYVTAKIYKGVFVPTAIYYDDMKIAEINKLN